MRRLLLTALAIALIVGTCAGVASARIAHDEATPAAARAPFLETPVAMPLEDPSQPGAWGFRDSDELAADIAAPRAATHAGASSSGAAGTVTVTATVLPVVFIVVDDSGSIVELFTNTPDRDARTVLYVVREDTISGSRRDLDASTWAGARAALAEAGPGTGSIWTA